MARERPMGGFKSFLVLFFKKEPLAFSAAWPAGFRPLHSADRIGVFTGLVG
jgi:hypothetical protein